LFVSSRKNQKCYPIILKGSFVLASRQIDLVFLRKVGFQSSEEVKNRLFHCWEFYYRGRRVSKQQERERERFQ
jgi:hypothetical protein